MKVIIIVMAAMLFSICSIKAQSYRISGEIKGLDVDTGFIFIKDPAAKRGVRIEKIPFEKGKFDYISTIQSPEVLMVSFRSDALTKRIGKGYIPAKSALLQYVAYPGADIKVKGEATDFCNAYPYGDKENELLAAMNKAIYPLMNKQANLAVKNATDTKLTDAQKEANNKEAEKLYNQVIHKKKEYLKKNAATVAGLWLMEDMVIRSQIEIEKVAELMETVDAKYSNISYFEKLTDRVKGYKESGVGVVAPAINGKNTLDGTDFNLASLKGKYVIIDFWGTWCGACVAGLPEMKKFSDAHSDKLQIVGVANDKNEQMVKKMMEKKGMNWPNVLVGEGEQDYVAKYNVQGYPTKILLDRNGKILLRSVGETEDFYQEIEKLIVR